MLYDTTSGKGSIQRMAYWWLWFDWGRRKNVSNVHLQVYFWNFSLAPLAAAQKSFFQCLWFVLTLFHDVGLHVCICILQPRISEAGERKVIKGWSISPLNIAWVRENRVQATRLLLAEDGKVFAPQIICNVIGDEAQRRIMLIEPVGIRQQARILKLSKSLFSPLKKKKSQKPPQNLKVDSCPCGSQLYSCGLLTPLTPVTNSISLN